jgi:5-methylcytosine-specific restriction enzyme A
MFREFNPWCLGCAAIGLRVEATVVDHIVPHQGDQARFWQQDNWQPSCKWHHDSIKPMLEREWRAGKLSDVGLRLDSERARRLTKTKHRPAIGVDGLPIPGT